MTKKDARFLFEHQGDFMNEWKLEMLIQRGYIWEANEKWNWFIEKLLDSGAITQRQYNNWKDDIQKTVIVT